MNIVTASFNTIVRQMTEMFQQKNRCTWSKLLYSWTC